MPTNPRPQGRSKFVIIDGNALLHRAWHALPPLMTKSGEMVNAVYGFTSILLKVLKDIKPQYIAVAWDLKGATFRHELYKEYKATREKKPQELYNQISLIKDVLKVFNIASFEKKGFEADDLIGTLSHEHPADVESLIVTGDLDTLQLVNDNTYVYTLKKGISDIVIYDEAAVKERYGLRPDQLIDFKALRGDPSDNIPGVAGIGDKTATELLQKFGTLEAIYMAIDSDKPDIKEKLQEKLKAGRTEAFLSKKLSIIVRDVDINFSLANTQLGKIDRDEVVKLFQRFEFISLLAKVPEVIKSTTQSSLFGPATVVEAKPGKAGKSSKTGQPKTSQPDAHSEAPAPQANFKTIANLAEATELAKGITRGPIFISVLGDSPHPVFSKCHGVGLSVNDQTYYVPAQHLKPLKPILEDPKILKVGYDLKADQEILSNEGIAMPAGFDLLLASYLVNPGSRSLSQEELIFSHLGIEIKSLEKIIKEFKTWPTVPPAIWQDFAASRALGSSKLYPIFQATLKKENLNQVLSDIEMPLIEVLSRMEQFGVKIDVNFLKNISKKFSKEIVAVSSKIFALAGEEFNISSPLQLKKILFEKLKIPVARIKKTKTGLSTAAAELEKMRGLHPIIDLISHYRELTKLQSTYLDALPVLVSPQTGRVHTTFNQAVAATGRLSSSNPNLQNIPIKTEIGRQIRQAFVAEKGFQLIKADYSQIELRVAACLAHDKNMIATFQKGEDIHRRTAAEVYGVPMDQVTDDMRSAAKTINFGVLYGQGPHALSQQTGMSFEEAREFIAKYFQVYQGVHEYLESLKRRAVEKGYVETLFGRKRYLPEINSGVPVLQASAERMATNAPLQGTAADLMKMAMINIYRELYAMKGNGQGQQARMILQVHDELVFEVTQDWVERVAKLVRTRMEGAYKMEVPLAVKVSVGPNWGETEATALC